MKQRSQTLRKQVFERDNFTCRKCGFKDETMAKLEAHHVVLLGYGGKDELDNLITLCFDCHHFAPNTKEEFLEYLKEEMTGTATILMKSIEKVRKEHPELFEKVQRKLKS